jgi:hypothetical protein
MDPAPGEGVDQREQCAQRLLTGMPVIAGVPPRQVIAHGIIWHGRAALRQEIGLFMVCCGETS